MQTHNLTIASPAFEPHALSEATVLGAAVWLWMHSNMHQGAPLSALNALLIPAIKTGQYLLAFENEQPVAYVAWAKLDTQAETRYLNSAMQLHEPSDWQSGDRCWFTDYISPFGHARQIKQLLTHQLFTNGLFRSLYHRGDDKGLRIIEFHGVAIHPAEARHWFDTHPVISS